MRIDGAGGCFDNRIYEDLDFDVAWNIAMLSINEMGVTIDSIDNNAKIIHFHNKQKIMQVAVQRLDEDIQVIMDSTKERLQIYNWKAESGEVNMFFGLFESKLKEYRAFTLCPHCSAKVSSLAKFCPECGTKLK